jgi:coenzyme F420-reducing hydrogenase delta subunit
MCSGRINPLFIIKSLQEGADGVLISGCHPGDCHYSEGNFFARRRFAVIRSLLKYIGIEPERVRMSWVSASEGGKFAEIIKQMTDELKELGPNTKFVRERI